VPLAAASAAAVDAGVWLRPFRNLIYAMPPYIATDGELRAIARRWWRPPRRAPVAISP